MKVIPTELSEVRILEPVVFSDARGFFSEWFSGKRNSEFAMTAEFVQDNHSRSHLGVLRGLHFQHPHGQVKLVKAVTGTIFDVAVDVRAGSPTFGKWTGVLLSEDNHRLLYIPQGFAHGFCVLSDRADVLYKCSDYYSPKDECGVRWDDPQLAIAWPVDAPKVSERDLSYPLLHAIPLEKLPRYN